MHENNFTDCIKEKAQKLAEIYESLAKGELWERYVGNEWVDYLEGTEQFGNGPHFNSDLTWWRKKVKAKRIGFSIAVASGIDMEFSDDSEFGFRKTKVSTLVRIRITPGEIKVKYVDAGEFQWKFCRPRFNHWNHWEGGQNSPIPEGFLFDIRLRDGSIHRHTADTLVNWRYGSAGPRVENQIIGFRIIALAEGYCWPWEIDQ